MREQIKNLINSLPVEDFRILIREYNKAKYKTNEVRIVDGPYDGGNDLEIFVNGKDIKRNIQITIQKQNFEAKLFTDLEKAYENVEKFSYLKNFSFYTNQNISKNNKNELILKSELDYDINLEIIDANTLSQVIEDDYKLKELLYKFHDIKDERDKYFDKNTKIIFDILTHNRNTVEIKRNFISSHIYSFLLSNPQSKVKDIIDYILSIFDNKIEPEYIDKEINSLRLKQLIKTDKETKIITLSKEKQDEIQKIYETVSSDESLFLNNIRSFLLAEELQIDLKTIIDLLYKIYQENYNIDIEELKESSNSYSGSLRRSYNDLMTFFLANKIDEYKAKDLSSKLLEVCGESEFLTKYSTVHLFNNLFSSNKLEKYLNSKEQRIFIDTQILLRLLCIIYPKKDYKFKDSALSSVSLFHRTAKKLKDQLFLLTSTDYIEEVAIHLANAVKLKRFMDLPYIQKIGTTKNVFYNAFLEYSEYDVIEPNTTFTEFLGDMLGIEDSELENGTHDEIVNLIFDKVYEMVEYLGVEIITHELYPNFQAIKREYEIHLSSTAKERAYNAIQNDLRTILYLATREKHLNELGVFEEPYLLTWDSSFYSIRKILMNQKAKLSCSFWYIYSPLKLVDRLSVMNFNLNPEMLNLNIIALTENNFNYSSKKASFIDVITSFFNKRDISELEIIKKLSALHSQTIALNIDEENAKEFAENEEESPILKILIDIRNYFGSSSSKYSFKDIVEVFESQENEKQIIDILNNILKTKNNKVEYSEFEKLIKKGNV